MLKIYLENIQSEKWREYVNRIPMLKVGVEVLEKLSRYGDAYIVGGSVRDIIRGAEDNIKDIDIATNVPMEVTEKLFKTHDIGKNKDFGIVVIEYKGFDFEVANFRSDGTYSDGRRPESVKIEMSFKEDAKRRDFTINAMAIDSKGNIIDYFDGIKAIQNKILKTVGDPKQRFKEDYLRMLRSFRFASRLGFKIEDKTLNAIKRNAHNITKISQERILKELIKMAQQSGDKFADALIQMNDAGILQYILPEIVQMDAYEHDIQNHPEGAKVRKILKEELGPEEDYDPKNPEHNDPTKYIIVKTGNVLDHTFAALRSNNVADPIINLAILFHDIGKIITRTYDENGRVRYLSHAKEGIKLIELIASRLKMDNDTKDALIFTSENHMKIHNLLNMSNYKIFELIKNKHWDVLYNVALVDAKARGDLFSKQDWDKIVNKIEEITKIYADKDFQSSLRKIVNGELIMRLKNLKPGPNVGKIINQTIEWILNNNININNIEKIKKYIIDIKI